MKSVRTRILTTICLFVVAALLIVGGVTIFLNNWTTNSILEQTMSETVVLASDRVSYHLQAYKTVAEDSGRDPILIDPDATLEQKQAYLDNICAKFPEFTRGNILDANGVSIFTGQEFSDREYYKQSIKGTSWVSDPLVSKVTGAVTIIVSGPIYDGNTVVGVIYFVPVETFLNEIVASIKLSPAGNAVMINKQGIVVAHTNMEYVASYHNAQDLAKSDSAYKDIAKLEQQMTSGKKGFDTLTVGGRKEYVAYAPISNTDGWSIRINAPISDFMSYTNFSIIITSILLAIAVIAAVIIAASLANGIGAPLKLLSGALSDMASTGKINIDADIRAGTRRCAEKKDEVGEIARSANGLIDMLSESSSDLERIANGDLTVSITPRSPDDTLGNALRKMVNNLSDLFSDIHNATIRVATGSRQIADGSQSLAQGSTEQAAAVEQLSSSISEVATKTKENADMAQKASHLAETIKVNAEKGSNQMNTMMDAVREINQASHSINKVIKVIDDIAFQTNILALNAAVEAARAGQHGKGFAVVAEEVRNLAAKSAEAAKDTGGLIANSMEKAELGAKIAGETAASLAEIVSGINESTEIVIEIAKSSEEQSNAITQINKGIDQVAQVVQQNSATAEESAAASQEMSGQSDMLESLISQFKLNDQEEQYASTNDSTLKRRLPNLHDKAMGKLSSDERGSYGKY